MSKAINFVPFILLVAAVVVFAGDSTQKTVKLNVEGMTCWACAQTVKSALSEVDGVSKAELKLADGSAEVKYDSKKTDVKAIVKAVNATGFKVVDDKAKSKAKSGCGENGSKDCCKGKKDTAI